MVHLLEADPGDERARDVVSMVNDFIKDMESHIRILKATHEEYVERAKGCTAEREEEIDSIVKEHSNYLGKVREEDFNALLLFNKFNT